MDVMLPTCCDRHASGPSPLQAGVVATQPPCGREVGAAKIPGWPALPTERAPEHGYPEVSRWRGVSCAVVPAAAVHIKIVRLRRQSGCPPHCG